MILTWRATRVLDSKEPLLGYSLRWCGVMSEQAVSAKGMAGFSGHPWVTLHRYTVKAG